MNEDENMVCDGCGDERPAVPAIKETKPSFDFESGGPEETKDQAETETEPESGELQIDSDSQPDDKLEAADQDEKEDLVAEPEPLSKLDIENEDYESPTIATPPPIFSPTPSPPPTNIHEDEETPSLSFTSQRLYMVFVNTPAQSLVKSRVAIEFDVFPVISVGRNPENVIVVPDQEVSRKHAQLSLEGGRVVLKDLQSANGTFVYDGKQFQRVNGSVEIKPNTIMKFGSGTIVRLVNE